MKHTILLLWLTLGSVFTAAAGVYKWVDADGNIHYSDQPLSADAKEMQLPELSTYSAPATTVAPKAGAVSGSTAPAPATRQFQVMQPGPQETIRSNDGTMMVQYRLVPGLKSGQYVQIELDGALQPEQHQTQAIGLTGIERGEHRLALVLFDAEGRSIARTTEVVFFLHQASLLAPQRRPAPGGG